MHDYGNHKAFFGIFCVVSSGRGLGAQTDVPSFSSPYWPLKKIIIIEYTITKRCRVRTGRGPLVG